MSDLQISLIVIGIIIIAGVAVYNWAQQMRHRRKMQAAFDHEHDDVLLDKKSNEEPNTRIEPKLNKSVLAETQPAANVTKKPTVNTDTISQENSSETNPPAPSTIPAVTSTTGVETTNFDSFSNYIIHIQAKSAIPSAQVSPLLQNKLEFGKPLYWLGKTKDNQSWTALSNENNMDKTYIELKGCLQLADRAGPISEVDLSKFRDMVQDFAAKHNASVECPDIVTTHEQAIVLDKLCAEVDVMIGINIISKDDGAFVGTKIRALAEASGFYLDSDGLFRYRDEFEQVLFTLTNYESAPFLPENMKTLTTHGITFLLDVPRVANGEKVFDQMTHLAKIFSNTLGGILVDDNRVPLSGNGIARSKQQLIDIQSVMKKNKIPAGGQSALRLFV